MVSEIQQFMSELQEFLDRHRASIFFGEHHGEIWANGERIGAAGVATIRAAIFDCLDAGDHGAQWRFYQQYTESSHISEDAANTDRVLFAAAVIARIAELQAAPHGGVKLQDLCDFHKRRALPVPTAGMCPQCQAEKSMFTFYWKDGKREVLPGNTPAEALNKAGYGQGAVAALDFHCKGDNRQYEWKDRRWISLSA